MSKKETELKKMIAERDHWRRLASKREVAKQHEQLETAYERGVWDGSNAGSRFNQDYFMPLIGAMEDVNDLVSYLIGCFTGGGFGENSRVIAKQHAQGLSHLLGNFDVAYKRLTGKAGDLLEFEIDPTPAHDFYQALLHYDSTGNPEPLKAILQKGRWGGKLRSTAIKHGRDDADHVTWAGEQVDRLWSEPPDWDMIVSELRRLSKNQPPDIADEIRHKLEKWGQYALEKHKRAVKRNLQYWRKAYLEKLASQKVFCDESTDKIRVRD